jgi:3-ketosteroid 9alpha-monooxygenase subunit B
MNTYHRFRLYHWSLAALFVGMYLSGDSAETLHVWLGYGFIALLCSRLLALCCAADGFPRLLAPRRVAGAAKARLGKGLTSALLATLAMCSMLGWLMIDNVEFISSAISLGLPDAWKLTGLDGEILPGDPAETHAFLANLALGLVAAHLGFLLLFARKPAWAMLSARRRTAASGNQITLRVRAIHEETAESRSLELVPALAGYPLPAYQAGQYLHLQVPCSDQPLGRCYSLSSTPGLDDCLRITVKRVPGGRASNWLLNEPVVGMTLHAKGPAGSFVRPSRSGDALLLAAGSGITPIYSILRDVLENGSGHVRLIYLNRSADSAIFAASLQTLQQHHRQHFSVHNRYSDEGGRAGREELLRLLQQWAGEEVFICGNADFMDLASDCLRELGAPPHRVHREHFAGPSRHLAPTGAVTHGIQVELKGQTVQVDGCAGDALLDSLERAGLHPPAGCRSGQCGACRCRVVSGDVRLRHNEVLNDEEIAQGWTLACQAEVSGKSVQVRF